MSCLEEHCRRSLERYGFIFTYLHQWIDEAVKMFGPTHQWSRHNIEEAKEKVNLIFPNKSEEERILFLDVIQDHILFDYLESKSKIKIIRNINYNTFEPVKRLKHYIKINKNNNTTKVAVAKLMYENKNFSIENPIRQSTLANALDIIGPKKGPQKVQNIMRKLQKEGLPIITTNKGMFLAITKEDFVKCCNWHNKKIDSEQKTLINIRKLEKDMILS